MARVMVGGIDGRDLAASDAVGAGSAPARATPGVDVGPVRYPSHGPAKSCERASGFLSRHAGYHERPVGDGDCGGQVRGALQTVNGALP